ncbi:MAG TPA: EVE domain-containing protein [Turneriella sp.]|nr:EVE domain-containing protein [Turneriella sp.]HNE18415.1 EVE domain-containing protein [Turneriella sp.]HNJ66127.1 EVE domain-containing protein [Turneriella sp.]HNL10151.1 EVE domain-containing protein [Turneriella sp.]HNL55285.1 EVE domain-containing protein [Turneriella sp.]
MKPAGWLLKSEPETFSIDNLQASPQKTTLWDGVRNYMARNNLVAMQKGDRAFFYHSSCPVPGIVGEMVVASAAMPDPAQFDAASPYFDARSTPEKPRWFAPKMKFVKKYPATFTREQMVHTSLGSSQLFTHTRLSVIALSAAEIKAIDQWLGALARK